MLSEQVNGPSVRMSDFVAGQLRRRSPWQDASFPVLGNIRKQTHMCCATRVIDFTGSERETTQVAIGEGGTPLAGLGRR